MATHRYRVLANFAAFPSTTQHVERLVKFSDFCLQTGKGECMGTAFAIASNGFRSETTTVVETPAAGGADNGDGDLRRGVWRGPKKIQDLVVVVDKKLSQFAEVAMFEGDDFVRKQDLTRESLSKASSFQKVREAKQSASFKATLTTDKVPNAKQKAKGYHCPPRLLGLVNISDLRAAKHLRDIKLELVARGVDFETNETFKPLQKRLQADLISKWKISNPGKKEDKDKSWRFFRPISAASFVPIGEN